MAVALIATINVGLNLHKNNKLSSEVILANTDALSQEINYHVPDKSNDPKTCTISLYFAAGAEISSGNYATTAGYYTVSGIKNTCRTGSAGCDPYNCHRRVI